MGWAQSNGLATPGGFVLPADRFWAALDACSAREQARYLEQAAFRLDPRHTLDIAASIVDTMKCAATEALARTDAEAAFARLAGSRIVCRSSSAMEDGRAAAFPGVFLSVLDLDSPADLAAAIADCWRSVFSANAIRYLLRAGAEPVDFSLAVLLQRQVEAAWYGLYVSVDPLTGAAGPMADLSDAGPEAIVGGAGATLQARRRAGRWTGIDGAPSMATSLEAVRQAAEKLAGRLQTDVDVEFALPQVGGEPVILQCRPLTHVRRRKSDDDFRGIAEGRLVGRPCAAGHAAGVAADPHGGENDGQPEGTGIAVVERITTAEYGIVFRHAGVVMEHDASPLSHVATLCRELGVPFICGVDGARARLGGRWAVMNGGSGEIEILRHPDAASRSAPPPPPPEPTLSAVELLLRLLAEGRRGHPPAAEAELIARRYARALRTGPVRLVMHPVDPAELERLERFGAALFGPDFSATPLLASLARHRPPAGP